MRMMMDMGMKIKIVWSRGEHIKNLRTGSYFTESQSCRGARDCNKCPCRNPASCKYLLLLNILTEAGKASRIWSVDACACPTVISPSSYRRGDLGPRASCVICERIVEILKPRQRPLWLPAQNRAEAGVSLHPTYWVGLRRQESSPAHLGGQGRAALEARIGLVSQSECFLKERNRNISSLVIF